LPDLPASTDHSFNNSRVDLNTHHQCPWRPSSGRLSDRRDRTPGCDCPPERAEWRSGLLRGGLRRGFLRWQHTKIMVNRMYVFSVRGAIAIATAHNACKSAEAKPT